MSGLIIAAPSSGSGKTTITLGLLRALYNRGKAIRSAKSGPDYIDPKFHEAASHKKCFNLDSWAMKPENILALASGVEPLLIEGAMGLFDGAPPKGKGASSDLAKILNIPVVLIVDVSHQAQSVAPIVQGFANHSPTDVHISGLILNKIGSARHEAMLRTALDPIDIPILGCVYRNPELSIPSRHLGLIQASEHNDLENFLNKSADIMEKSINIDAFLALFQHLPATKKAFQTIPPPAQSIAVASDAAFTFAYPHLLNSWHHAGTRLSFFSPLNNEAPAPDADLVFLPGGYPELYAGRLSQNQTFIDGMKAAKSVYGECGGYMIMGNGMIDANGTRHKMLGFLNLETSFYQRKLSLGYRSLFSLGSLFHGKIAAHEFHYTTTHHAIGSPLFKAQDSTGKILPDMGLQNGSYSGSFAHIIDQT